MRGSPQRFASAGVLLELNLEGVWWREAGSLFSIALILGKLLINKGGQKRTTLPIRGFGVRNEYTGFDGCVRALSICRERQYRERYSPWQLGF